MTDQQMLDKCQEILERVDELAIGHGKGISLMRPMASILTVLMTVVIQLVHDDIKIKAALRSRGSKI